MEREIITILLSMLGSSVLTALITTLGRNPLLFQSGSQQGATQRTDQVVIDYTLFEHTMKDHAQKRNENRELQAG